MQQLSLLYKSSVINYYVFGSGAKVLFCLHGYGENGNSFAFLEKYLGLIYTLYAIDFPIHGNTKWNEKKPFTINDFFVITQMIEKDKSKKFSLLAYSMGGRFAMALLQKFPDKIERVALIAPDGLHLNIWYWMATQTSLGNKIFAYTMHKPHWFFSSINISGKLAVLNKSVVKFVHHFLDEKEQRILLYKRWTCMRKVKPDLNAIKNICTEKNIQLNFLFGRYDRIILSKRADVFRNAKNISIQVIEASHQLLKEKYTKEITALLND
ncbi:MAG TPA: alpha/beta hydrolase [Parafilimonas sp.]